MKKELALEQDHTWKYAVQKNKISGNPITFNSQNPYFIIVKHNQ